MCLNDQEEQYQVPLEYEFKNPTPSIIHSPIKKAKTLQHQSQRSRQSKQQQKTLNLYKSEQLHYYQPFEGDYTGKFQVGDEKEEQESIEKLFNGNFQENMYESILSLNSQGRSQNLTVMEEEFEEKDDLEHKLSQLQLDDQSQLLYKQQDSFQ